MLIKCGNSTVRCVVLNDMFHERRRLCSSPLIVHRVHVIRDICGESFPVIFSIIRTAPLAHVRVNARALALGGERVDEYSTRVFGAARLKMREHNMGWCIVYRYS